MSVLRRRESPGSSGRTRVRSACRSGMSLSNPAVHDEFVERLKYWNREFEGGEENEQMCRIMNERNFDRLKGLLEMSEGDRVYGGRMNWGRRYIQATVVTGVDVQGSLALEPWSCVNLGLMLIRGLDSLMSEELLVSICPVIKADYITANQTIKYVPYPLPFHVLVFLLTTDSMPVPLAIYIFSRDSRQIEENKAPLSTLSLRLSSFSGQSPTPRPYLPFPPLTYLPLQHPPHIPGANPLPPRPPQHSSRTPPPAAQSSSTSSSTPGSPTHPSAASANRATATITGSTASSPFRICAPL